MTGIPEGLFDFGFCQFPDGHTVYTNYQNAGAYQKTPIAQAGGSSVSNSSLLIVHSPTE